MLQLRAAYLSEDDRAKTTGRGRAAARSAQAGCAARPSDGEPTRRQRPDNMTRRRLLLLAMPVALVLLGGAAWALAAAMHAVARGLRRLVGFWRISLSCVSGSSAPFPPPPLSPQPIRPLALVNVKGLLGRCVVIQQHGPARARSLMSRPVLGGHFEVVELAPVDVQPREKNLPR
jgi:hypothetical protein